MQFFIFQIWEGGRKGQEQSVAQLSVKISPSTKMWLKMGHLRYL